MSGLEKEFPVVVATFANGREAEAWAEGQGWSVGRMQADGPRGIMMGDDHDIAKWHNLDDDDVARLDAVIVHVHEPHSAFFGEPPKPYPVGFEGETVIRSRMPVMAA